MSPKMSRPRRIDRMKELFSTFDIEKRLGIERTALQEWINKGFIKPTIAAKGKGTKALFNKDDSSLLLGFCWLVRMGFKRSFAADIINNGMSVKGHFLEIKINKKVLEKAVEHRLQCLNND